jgi:hypothetical protein
MFAGITWSDQAAEFKIDQILILWDPVVNSFTTKFYALRARLIIFVKRSQSSTAGSDLVQHRHRRQLLRAASIAPIPMQLGPPTALIQLNLNAISSRHSFSKMDVVISRHVNMPVYQHQLHRCRVKMAITGLTTRFNHFRYAITFRAYHFPLS